MNAVNEYPFSMQNVILSTKDGYIDVEDINYTCVYSVVRVRDDESGWRDSPLIDLKSFKRQEGKAFWLPCQMPIPIVEALESRIQECMDREQTQDEMAALEA